MTSPIFAGAGRASVISKLGRTPAHYSGVTVRQGAQACDNFLRGGVMFSVLRASPVPGRYVLDDIEVSSKPIHEIDYQHECRSLAVDVLNSHIEKGWPSINGIFDTGAQSVCLKTGIPSRWGFTNMGHAKVSGANGTASANVWRGDIKIDVSGIILLKNVVVWETNLPGSIEALIGQPVIKLFEFKVWAGFKGVTLERPKVA